MKTYKVLLPKTEMSKEIKIRIPSWFSEEKFKRAVNELVSELSGVVSIEELRRELGIRPEDLTEDLEVYDAKELREKEKRRMNGEAKSRLTLK